MTKLITWKVQEAPTGYYRSFSHRGWPQAFYAGNRMAASIECEDSYRPADARNGTHAPLIVRVADYSAKPTWTWRKMKGQFATLAEAKAAFEALLAKTPTLIPEDLR